MFDVFLRPCVFAPTISLGHTGILFKQERRFWSRFAILGVLIERLRPKIL